MTGCPWLHEPSIYAYMLIRQIRSLPPEQGRDIQAIALTAYTGEINQQKILQAGFQKHLTKPIEPDQLVITIVSLVK
ncbi:hypothetical protein IQ244_25265 [Nostoc sp. LEGE 06077]|uniref:hypothetical protein n=1 Tax=Nostoc sp. LEGE 06077 TaxID=915325 RepID=UPI00187E1347|nr:hypothetical protein [Nostoc sp. LEGE 06077]MBE9209743.1 hypothetical protein [Nostoc sp. LEGE 06077]